MVSGRLTLLYFRCQPHWYKANFMKSAMLPSININTMKIIKEIKTHLFIWCWFICFIKKLKNNVHVQLEKLLHVCRFNRLKKALTVFYKCVNLDIVTINTCNKLSLIHFPNALQTPKYVIDNIVLEKLVYGVTTLLSRLRWIKAYFSSIETF